MRSQRGGVKVAVALALGMAVAGPASSQVGPPPVTYGNHGGEIQVQLTYLGTVSPCLGGHTLHALQINLVDILTPGDAISSVDVDIIRHATRNPLGLHQQWGYAGGDIPSPDNDPNVLILLPAPQVDTHFLIGPGGTQNWQGTIGPGAEDNDGTCGLTPAGGKEGFGTTLSVASAVTPILTTMELAYVVVDSPSAWWGMTGTASDGNGEIFDVSFWVPEPTAGLLLLAGLGVLLRRRRR